MIKMSLAENIRSRVQQARSRALYGNRAQMKLGGGAFIEQARRRADEIARRATERRPGMIPMVQEFKPGQRIQQFMGQVTDTRGRYKDMSIQDEGGKPYDGRGISIMPE